MSKTSSKAKDRYNRKAYAEVRAKLPKSVVEAFKAKCAENGTSQASVLRAAIERFLEVYNE